MSRLVDHPDYISILGVSCWLSVPMGTVRRWIKAGRIETHPGYPESVSRSSVDAFVASARSIAEPVTNIRQGVYFVQVGDFVKIGIAENVIRRWATGGTDTPYPVTPLGYIHVEDGSLLRTIESDLHAKFADDRHRLEWFRKTEALAAYIAEHARPWPL